MTNMTFNRTADTIALNARLQIVRLDQYEFDTPKGRATVRGWGFFIPGLGVLHSRIGIREIQTRYRCRSLRTVRRQIGVAINHR